MYLDISSLRISTEALTGAMEEEMEMIMGSTWIRSSLLSVMPCDVCRSSSVSMKQSSVMFERIRRWRTKYTVKDSIHLL